MSENENESLRPVDERFNTNSNANNCNNSHVLASHSNSGSSTNVNPLRKNAKLPTLKLKKFDGTPENFTAFAEQFKSLVHDNEQLDSVAKFIYLKSSFDEELSKVIQSIEQ